MILRILNGVFFYAGWCIAVMGAAGGYGALSSLVPFFLAVLYITLIHERKREYILLFFVVLIGLFVDSSLILSNVLVFKDPNLLSPSLAPLWVLSIYALFSTTLNGSLVWLRKNLFLAAIFGFFGGGFSYTFGEKVGAVFFPLSTAATFMIIGSIWFFLFPFFLLLNDRVTFYLKMQAK